MSAFSEAFAVRFKDLELWGVNSFHKTGWMWSPENIKPLSAALKRRRDEVNKRDHAFETLQLATIHFDGTIEPRELRGKQEFKGALFFAHPGDVVYSKIDVRHGAIGIVSDEMPRLAVSNEFPIYEVRADVATPQYIKLLFRTAEFRKAISGMISGASGRKRVQPEQLERLEVPLPPLDTQRAIVARWQAAQYTVRAARDRATNLQRQIKSDVRKALWKDDNETKAQPRYFALNWVQIEKWGVGMSWHNLIAQHESLYPILMIADVCQIGSGGTPSRKNPAYFGGTIAWVKTTEVRDNLITTTEETITETGLQNSSAKIYPAGSIIVAMYGQGATRGRTAKLGINAATNQACAVLTNFDNRVEADYVWVYLTSEYTNLRQLASGNNQPNLNAEMIATYPLPLPPLEVQREIIERVMVGRAEVARERERAERISHESIKEIEALILGTESIASVS